MQGLQSQPVFLFMDGLCCHALRRTDIFRLCGTVNDILACGKSGAFFKGEAAHALRRRYHHVGIIGCGGTGYGMQDVFSI